MPWTASRSICALTWGVRVAKAVGTWTNPISNPSQTLSTCTVACTSERLGSWWVNNRSSPTPLGSRSGASASL